MSTATYPEPQPHKDIEEIFPDVFIVRGSMSIHKWVCISRVMTILRHEDQLLLINPIRLNTEGEAQLLELGKITHVFRLGYFHGVDDAYYVEQFKAKFWCQSSSNKYPNPSPDVLMDESTPMPFPDMSLFVFENAKHPEAAILYQHHGGLLITCDSVQHYDNWDGCSIFAKVIMKLAGFRKSTLIGPMWLKGMTPEDGSLEEDFDRLLHLEFKHLISAHGDVCREKAHYNLEDAFDRIYSG